MFTGIIEEMGMVCQRSTLKNTSYLKIQASKVLEGTKIGDSIAVNGVCLTVLEITPNSFTTALMPETIQRTNFDKILTGDRVNLERALKVSDRLNGHIVTGHIDGTGKIQQMVKSEQSVLMTIQTPTEFSKYIVEKGSVAIDGISLTLVDFDADSFRVSLLSYTLAETTLGFRKIGDRVNLEGDILAKYAERLIHFNNQEKKTNLTINFLEEHGFI